MQEITLETKIYDLLNDYEGMKEILIGINPKFKKLNNPVLRRTIGRVAGVKQAAIVGDMAPKDLLDQLRAAVGQESLCEGCVEESAACHLPEPEPRPAWASGKPREALDANKILDADQNPLALARKALGTLDMGEFITIAADFRPEPLIDSFLEKGYGVYVEEQEEGTTLTYVRRAQ